MRRILQWQRDQVRGQFSHHSPLLFSHIPRIIQVPYTPTLKADWKQYNYFLWKLSKSQRIHFHFFFMIHIYSFISNYMKWKQFTAILQEVDKRVTFILIYMLFMWNYCMDSQICLHFIIFYFFYRLFYYFKLNVLIIATF